MYFFRYDGNILDFTRGPYTDKILKRVDNCFVRERKDRVTLYKLNLTMSCEGNFDTQRPLDFYTIINKKKNELTCERCNFALLGGEKFCSVNCFLLPQHFHHKKVNFKSQVVLKAKRYLQLPVPDPMTWSYMTFRY